MHIIPQLIQPCQSSACVHRHCMQCRIKGGAGSTQTSNFWGPKFAGSGNILCVEWEITSRI